MSSKYMSMSDMGRAAEQTELQRAANEQLIKEGRIMKHNELEKRRREEENGELSGRADVNTRTNSSAASHRSSIDTSSSASTRNMDVREMRTQLSQFEEKFKGAMMANVQLDNEKQLLKYEVDLLKDKLEDLNECYASLNKTYLENKRELSYQRMQIAELTHRLNYACCQVEARDKLLVEHDLILIGGTPGDAAPPLTNQQLEGSCSGLVNHSYEIPNGNVIPNNCKQRLHNDADSTVVNKLPEMVLISKSTAKLLNTLDSTTLDKRIIELFDKQSASLDQIEKLQNELREERSTNANSRYDAKNRTNGQNADDSKRELQQYRSQAQEFKLKYQESLLKISSMENDIVRLEGQAKRFKQVATACEKHEDDIRLELRSHKTQLRQSQSEVDSLTAENARLRRLLDNSGIGTTSSSSSLSSYRRKHESSVTK